MPTIVNYKLVPPVIHVNIYHHTNRSFIGYRTDGYGFTAALHAGLTEELVLGVRAHGTMRLRCETGANFNTQTFGMYPAFECNADSLQP